MSPGSSNGTETYVKTDLAVEAGGAQELLLHAQLLGKRLYIQAWVRFFVVGGIVAGTLGGKHVLGVENLDVPRLLLLSVLLCLFNLGAFGAARRFRHPDAKAGTHQFLQGLMHLTISVDFLFLTAFLWLMGGARSPFTAFYLLHVILASILLSPRAAYVHAIIGYSLLTALVLGEWFHLVPMHVPVGVVNSNEPLDGRFVLTVLVVQGFLMGLTVVLVTSLANLLRQGEQQLRAANARLERVSNMHRDFFHIAMHDLKAPVSAATMLLQGLELSLTEEQRHHVERARMRLGEVNAFLIELQTLAQLESADIDASSIDLDVGMLLHNVVEENQDLAQMHDHALTLEVSDGIPKVRCVGRLLHEAVANLVTNAIKYTPNGGKIGVRARPTNGYLRIEVEDNGIGIAPENQGRLFEEFVRLRTSDSPVGQVAGGGLGLSIVRRILKAHGGIVGVESELDRGSVFFIELPLAQVEGDGA